MNVKLAIDELTNINSTNRVASANDLDYWFGLLASTIEGTVADSLIRANFALPFRVLKMGWLTQLMQVDN